MFFRKRNNEIEDLSNDIFLSHSRDESGFVGLNIGQGSLLIAIISLLFVLFILFSRSFYLQTLRGVEYRRLADGNRSRIQYLYSRRGLIYDVNGKPLIINKPDFSIYLNPLILPKKVQARDERISQIADLIEENPAEISDKLEQYSDLSAPLAVIKENINYEQALRFDLRFNEFPELHVASLSHREYLDPSFGHVLGYMGKINQLELDKSIRGEYLFDDVIGKSGLELAYENILRGDFGVLETEIDAAGREKKVIYEKPALPGSDLRLTLNLEFQRKIQQLTAQYLRQIGKKKGAVVVLNPADNSILGLVSLPTYDDNLFSQGISVTKYQELLDDKNQPLFDRAVSGEYPSGSTIKLIVGGAALEEGLVTENTSFLSTGGLWVANRWFFPDWKAGGHGYTNIYKAIADSVNTFFYTVGGGFGDFNGLGVDRLAKYYSLFGLGAPLGADLPNEASGLVPTPQWKMAAKNEEWYIGDTYHMAIGQGDVLVTPLQVAAYTSYFANGGKIIAPHIVNSVIDRNGNEQRIEPKIISKDIINAYNLKVMRAAMRRSVTDGSARYLNAFGFTSAGKTGTAELADNKPAHAWFTGFAPYEKPEIVVTVLIEEGGEGSAVSVPLAAQIMNLYFNEFSE